jgi:hypothetical protein
MSEESLTLPLLAVSILVFLLGLLFVRKTYEISISDSYVEYSIKGRQNGKRIKIEATDIVNPVGVVYFKDVEEIILNKEDKLIVLSLNNGCSVFYQWFEVEVEQLDEIYKSIINSMNRAILI